MSEELKIGAIFRLIDKLSEMKANGASEAEIEKLQDDIGDLQMNAIVGDLFDED